MTQEIPGARRSRRRQAALAEVGKTPGPVSSGIGPHRATVNDASRRSRQDVGAPRMSANPNAAATVMLDSRSVAYGTWSANLGVMRGTHKVEKCQKLTN